MKIKEKEGENSFHEYLAPGTGEPFALTLLALDRTVSRTLVFLSRLALGVRYFLQSVLHESGAKYFSSLYARTTFSRALGQ